MPCTTDGGQDINLALKEAQSISWQEERTKAVRDGRQNELELVLWPVKLRQLP